MPKRKKQTTIAPVPAVEPTDSKLPPTGRGKERFTLEPIKPGDFDHVSKEFGRTRDVERVYSVKRGSLYNAEKLGLVRGVKLRLKGQKSGIKLWHMHSVAAWIHSEMEAGAKECN